GPLGQVAGGPAVGLLRPARLRGLLLALLLGLLPGRRPGPGLRLGGGLLLGLGGVLGDLVLVGGVHALVLGVGGVLLLGRLFVRVRAGIAGVVVGVARGVAVADDGEGGADVDGLGLLGHDLLQGAGDGGGDLGVDLVGGDLEEGLVDLDGVALLLEPLGDGALGDGFAEFGHRHVGAATAAATSGVTAGGLLRRGGLGGGGRGGLLRGRLTGGLVGRARGAGAGVVAGAGAVADDGEGRPDLDGLVFPVDDRLGGAGQGSCDLGVGLVGGGLEEGLVDLDGVALLVEPLGDGALGDGFAGSAHRHVGAATAAATSGVTTGAAAGGLL